MKMQKRMLRIGQLAKSLAVERFVIRFWEKEFNIKPSRSVGGQRFYTEKDLALFQQIKQLLYEKRFTIAGAKKQLLTSESKTIIASKKTDFHEDSEQTIILQKKLLEQKNHFEEKIAQLQSKLRKLRDLL